MHRPVRGQLIALAAASVLLALGSCNKEETAPTPVASPPPAAPVRGVIGQASFDGFLPGLWVSIPLPLSQRGILDVTVDWTFPDSWISVYIGQQDCTFKQLQKFECPFFLRSEGHDQKPKIVVTGVLEPATYYVWLYNVPPVRKTDIGSENTESVSFLIGLTVGVSSPSSPGVSSSGAASSAPLRLVPRVVRP